MLSLLYSEGNWHICQNRPMNSKEIIVVSGHTYCISSPTSTILNQFSFTCKSNPLVLLSLLHSEGNWHIYQNRPINSKLIIVVSGHAYCISSPTSTILNKFSFPYDPLLSTLQVLEQIPSICHTSNSTTIANFGLQQKINTLKLSFFFIYIR